jgi:hypothetical protein
MFVCFFIASAVLSQDPGHQQPPEWIKELLKDSESRGFSTTGNGLTRRPMNRYEAAVNVFTAITNSDKELRRSEMRMPHSPDWNYWWQTFGEGRLPLGRALMELRPEFVKIVDEAEWQRQYWKAEGFKARAGDLWFRDAAPSLGYPSSPTCRRDIGQAKPPLT